MGIPHLLRVALLAYLAAAAACSLYFSPGDSDDDDDAPDAAPPPPPPPDPGDGGMARCEDGTLYQVDVPSYPARPPGHGAGTVIGTCGGACRSATVACADAACANASSLCEAAPATGKPCSLVGSACAAGTTTECPQSTTCGFSVLGSSCSCVDGSLACTPKTPIADVQARLVGKWRGTVTPPSFTEPYMVSLWIYPDGSYWAECTSPWHCIAFYYGSDGPHPDRTVSVLSSPPVEGAWADIRLFEGDPIGALSALVVDDTRLHFTFNASWHNCGQPFFFDLTRE